jgi:hypothetical protein
MCENQNVQTTYNTSSVSDDVKKNHFTLEMSAYGAGLQRGNASSLELPSRNEEDKKGSWATW